MGPAPLDDHRAMPKCHQFDAWDSGTNAPSSNFVYDFETYNFLVCDDWREVFACGADGNALSGSIEALAGRSANLEVPSQQEPVRAPLVCPVKQRQAMARREWRHEAIGRRPGSHEDAGRQEMCGERPELKRKE